MLTNNTLGSYTHLHAASYVPSPAASSTPASSTKGRSAALFSQKHSYKRPLEAAAFLRRKKLLYKKPENKGC